MALARTRPHEAASALSEWLQLFGIPAPNWLRNPTADARAQLWAGRVILVSLMGGILSGAVWVFAPTDKLIPTSDETVYGELRPANDPTPSNACDKVQIPIPPDVIKVILGDNVIGTSNFGHCSILRIGDCDAVSLDRTENGVFFNAQLQDNDDNRPVKIVRNKIEALNGRNYTSTQSMDRASLTVTNKKGVELFYVRFSKPGAILVRGFLGCSRNQSTIAQDGRPIPGWFMSENCMVNNGSGIQIGPPTPQAH